MGYAAQFPASLGIPELSVWVATGRVPSRRTQQVHSGEAHARLCPNLGSWKAWDGPRRQGSRWLRRATMTCRARHLARGYVCPGGGCVCGATSTPARGGFPPLPGRNFFMAWDPRRPRPPGGTGHGTDGLELPGDAPRRRRTECRTYGRALRGRQHGRGRGRPVTKEEEKESEGRGKCDRRSWGASCKQACDFPEPYVARGRKPSGVQVEGNNIWPAWPVPTRQPVQRFQRHHHLNTQRRAAGDKRVKHSRRVTKNKLSSARLELATFGCQDLVFPLRKVISR